MPPVRLPCAHLHCSCMVIDEYICVFLPACYVNMNTIDMNMVEVCFCTISSFPVCPDNSLAILSRPLLARLFSLTRKLIDLPPLAHEHSNQPYPYCPFLCLAFFPCLSTASFSVSLLACHPTIRSHLEFTIALLDRLFTISGTCPLVTNTPSTRARGRRQVQTNCQPSTCMMSTPRSAT